MTKLKHIRWPYLTITRWLISNNTSADNKNNKNNIEIKIESKNIETVLCVFKLIY